MSCVSAFEFLYFVSGIENQVDTFFKQIQYTRVVLFLFIAYLKFSSLLCTSEYYKIYWGLPGEKGRERGCFSSISNRSNYKRLLDINICKV